MNVAKSDGDLSEPTVEDPLTLFAARCRECRLGALRPLRISLAARSPERTASSMYPFQEVAVSVPAQWIGPTGARIVLP